MKTKKPFKITLPESAVLQIVDDEIEDGELIEVWQKCGSKMVNQGTNETISVKEFNNRHSKTNGDLFIVKI